MTAKRLNRFQQSYQRRKALVGLLAFLLAACSPAIQAPTASVEMTEAPFRPPTPAEQTATPPAQAATPTQSSTKQACLDNLSWVSDVTVPDGTEVDAKATLDKRWEVKNSGDCNWDERYRLRLIAGPAMGAAQEQALFPARSGSNAIIQIVFQAPSESGKHRSAWQAYNPDGKPFGDPIFIDINVK